MADSDKRWTRAEVDAAVAKWKTDIQTATSNILELMEDRTYKWLTGDGFVAPTLKGTTERRVVPAINALNELWQVYPLLQEVLTEVEDIHRNLPRMRNADELYRIQTLLTGESIKIKTKTTYAQRDLLTPAEVTRALTPQRILDAMVEAYGKAKPVVIEVGNTVRTLTEALDQSTQEVRELKKLAEELKEQVSEFTRLEARIAQINADILSDPLGMKSDFDGQINPLVQAARTRLEALKAQLVRVDAELAEALNLVASLDETHQKAKEAYADRTLKVTDFPGEQTVPQPFADTIVDDLRSWLGRLNATRAQGKWRAVEIGLRNWRAQMDVRLAHAQKAESENRTPLDRRLELRGLLDSLKAKAVNTGLAEDEQLAALYKEAYTLLYTRPTPLTKAEAIVSQYQALVR